MAAYIATVYSQWRLDTTYSKYEQFLKCFELDVPGHRDTGGSQVSYCQNFAYPNEVDPTNDYIDFILNSVKSMPFKNVKFSKSWWVDYPEHTYAGVHAHQPGKQFTAVLFLTTLPKDTHNPHAGFLYTMSNKTGVIEYDEYPTIAGNVHIFDGTIWHGTYPTQHNRKVFVCDFTYEMDGF